MKNFEKQLLSLMLTAVIFITPLFAMNEELPEGKVHACPLCKPELRFKDADDIKGKGYLHIYAKETTLSILEYFDVEHLLSFSTTSKAIYNLCQDPALWNFMAQKYGLALNPSLCIKEQLPVFLSLFSKKDKKYTYTVSEKQFEKFKKISCETTWWACPNDIYWKFIEVYNFSIGKNQFELYLRVPETVEQYLKENHKIKFYPIAIKMFQSETTFILGDAFKDKPGGYGKVYVRKIN